MSMPISVRRATESDADRIARLAGELGYAVDAEVMRIRVEDVLASSTDLLVVAVDSCDGVVGWLHAHAAHIIESGFRVEITGLIVSLEFRRRGVGRSLVVAAEDWAKSISAEAVVVRSNAKRVESHSFYPALGYTSTKTQMVYRKVLTDASKNHSSRREC